MRVIRGGLGYHSKRSRDSTPPDLCALLQARAPPQLFRSSMRSPTTPRPTASVSPPAAPGRAEAPPSKTRRKQDMHALQQLGVALVALDAKRLAMLDLPEPLADAIALARKLTPHEARRRQMQYIGRLMRDVDAAPIRDALAAWAEGSQHERAQFAALERWRDRVLDDPNGLQAFVAEHPAAPRDALAALVADARDERARGAPPRNARALFRALKRILDDEGGGAAPHHPSGTP
jgi:ribosome-associated protein